MTARSAPALSAIPLILSSILTEYDGRLNPFFAISFSKPR